MCLDVGEVLVDETRLWSTWAATLDVPRLTFLALLGGAIERWGDHTRAFDLLGVPGWRDTEPEVKRAFGALRADDLYVDARSALVGLREAGMGVAVVANQPADRHAELLALGIQPDVMAMSGALGVAKPDPGFFARILSLLGNPPPGEVAYVGDRIDNDVVPSRAAGMRAVWLRRGPWSLLAEDTGGAAHLVVTSLAELAADPDAAWR